MKHQIWSGLRVLSLVWMALEKHHLCSLIVLLEIRILHFSLFIFNKSLLSNHFLRERENPLVGSPRPLPCFPAPLVGFFFRSIPSLPFNCSLDRLSLSSPHLSSPLLHLLLRDGWETLLWEGSSPTLTVIFGLQRPRFGVFGLGTGSCTETLVGFGSGGSFLSSPAGTMKAFECDLVAILRQEQDLVAMLHPPTSMNGVLGRTSALHSSPPRGGGGTDSVLH